MSIQKFKDKLAENRVSKAQLDNATKEGEYYDLLKNKKPSNTFYLASKHFDGCMMMNPPGWNGMEQLIKLDDADIKYFIDKYFPKLEEENRIETKKKKNRIKKEIDTLTDKIDTLNKELK